MTCGNRPNRTPWRWLPPADWIPSTGFLSAASMASENSFPKAAKIAADDRENTCKRTQSHDTDPDQRPDQGIDTADGIEAAARQEVEIRFATTLRAASSETGNASSAPPSVPRNAIDSVSPSACK